MFTPDMIINILCNWSFSDHGIVIRNLNTNLVHAMEKISIQVWFVLLFLSIVFLVRILSKILLNWKIWVFGCLELLYLKLRQISDKTSLGLMFGLQCSQEMFVNIFLPAMLHYFKKHRALSWNIVEINVFI